MKKVWTNGCFDVMHRGHIEMLLYAKELGDYLIVGIDSDEKVTQNKGPLRPINCQEDRKYMLEALKEVDEVVVFNSADELARLIQSHRPSYMVVGSDWRGKKIIGAEYTQEVKFFERIGSYSTTNIIERIKEI